MMEVKARSDVRGADPLESLKRSSSDFAGFLDFSRRRACFLDGSRTVSG